MTRFLTFLLVAALSSAAFPLTVFAGTTGTLTGTAINATTKQPIAGAKITAASPSQIASVTADATGHFTFLALAPDTYTISVDAKGFESTSLSGITVAADQTRTLTLTAEAALRTIGRVTTRSSTSLVRPGTTSDVYSVDATQQAKVAGIGGGVNLNNAYSAIATVPGAFVDPQSGQQGGNGIGADVYIRGGDYDQVGYEIDGVPVNRSFDNYPSGPAATLGQQELQVYVGSAPANAESQGLAGFINQVIKIGSYPGFAGGNVGIGGPGFYHKAGIEFGGATSNRNFSYYVATDGYDQEFRYVDQYQGQSLSGLYGTPLAPCSIGVTAAQAPSCYNAAGQNYAAGTVIANNYTDPNNPNSLGSGAFVLGPYDAFALSQTKIRNSVVNLHFGLPHKDGTKDDIQFLGMENYVASQYADSTNDQGGATALANNGTGIPQFYDGFQYAGPTGTALPANYRQLTSPYLYPGNLQSAANFVNGPNFIDSGLGGPIPFDARDSISNDQGILKLQYTKTLGANALFKFYGYTYYSDWLQAGAQTAYGYYEGPSGPDYELSSHTRGVSGTFSDQLGSKNLLTLQGSYTTATTLRDNNFQMYSGGGLSPESAFAVLVNSKDPLGGVCYDATRAATTCSVDAGLADFATLAQAYTGTIPAAPAGNCGTGSCEYLVVGNGEYGAYNTVKPKFTSLSLTDQYRPNSKLSVDGGLRLDILQFVGDDTQQGPAREFWYNAFNLDTCLDPQSNLADKINDLGLASVNTPCSSVPGYTAADITNPAGIPSVTYVEYQPRLAFTYQLNPATVLRASYGRFTEPPLSAYQQYDTLEANAPEQLYSSYSFQKLGFTTPDHRVSPPTSNNYDFSIEHSFGDAAIKLTPFIRTTQGQIQDFYLDQRTGYVSGLNVGQQTSEGTEFELDKGNFGRDGLAAKLSLTYTHSYIRYTALPNGSNIIDPLNANIKEYNAYTSFCARNPNNAACGTTATGGGAAPCYGTDGTPVAAAAACTAADVANPYWNAPVQPLLDPKGNYDTYDTFPGGIGSSVSDYGAPYFGTLVVQYKHGRFAITPNMQFVAGERYGAPASTFGVAPDECTGTLASKTAGDPRYGFGAAGGGAPFDATTCGSLAGGIPDPYTGKFDNLGSFVAPMSLNLGTQVQYDVSKQLSLVATFANVYGACFGGSKTGFTVAGACGYGVVGAGDGGDIGNSYNPGAAIQPMVNSPYEPFFGNFPFEVYVSAQLHI
jgi:hypothetical protein